jgi:hypothetical protein
VQAFYIHPQVADVAADLRKTKGKYDQAKPTTRLASDPTLVALDKRAKDLEGELKQLWQRLQPAVVAQLTGTEADSTLAQVETELRGLKAREAALRKQRDQLRSERLRQLRQEESQLVAQFGPEHEKIRSVKEQIARLEDAPKGRETDTT